ncbi:MAG TPA: 30S ribosome-binding factor RbfA [Thermotogota bacterium]|jgi:ribosome-binding factor A|nr:30S ribosome-binding factor RbfA [Thermotogota bacterium]NLZ12684.1 30S ribosome-binding factor RbfA [Thermotogaceae bacterium]MDD8040726.1 30S ribosome-binding factor RbfA [Thermotogota bacterium]MDD8053089.1 30S ribosome-binding factor RbfA [Thermotogota bacterium]HNR62872.1 30S ribosome-binding factor RbfA [Thermotogota bacterium]
MPKVFRLEKLESDFLRILSQALLEWKNPDFPKEKISFTRVLLSKDKRYLDLFVSIFETSGSLEDRENLFHALQSHTKHFRSVLAKNSHMYVTPEIRMVFDRGIEESVRMQKIIDGLKNEG